MNLRRTYFYESKVWEKHQKLLYVVSDAAVCICMFAASGIYSAVPQVDHINTLNVSAASSYQPTLPPEGYDQVRSDTAKGLHAKDITRSLSRMST